MKSLTCVYCFEKFKPNEIKYRCLNPNPTFCPYEADVNLQRYLGSTIAPSNAKVIASNSQWNRNKAIKCSCGSDTKPVCPYCHNELPPQFGLTKSFIIALIGASEVGKSHYIAVLIHELKQRISTLFNASLGALNDWTTKQYNDSLWRFIYDKREVIPRTISARTDHAVKYPLVYRFNVPHSKFFIFNKDVEVQLVFFDAAGEDLTDLDTMKTVNKYIASSDGLIFLLDPLQIPIVRDLLPKSIPLPSENNDQEDIINRASIIIQTINRMKPNEKIKIPVAVAFSKMDALHSIVDPLLIQASNHRGYFNLTDSETTNDLFNGYLEKWFGGNIIQMVEKYFKQYSFFGLSALGSSPNRSGKITKGISPFRIEDPLLWILYKKGIIKGRRMKAVKNGF